MAGMAAESSLNLSSSCNRKFYDNSSVEPDSIYIYLDKWRPAVPWQEEAITKWMLDGGPSWWPSTKEEYTSIKEICTYSKDGKEYIKFGAIGNQEFIKRYNGGWQQWYPFMLQPVNPQWKLIKDGGIL